MHTSVDQSSFGNWKSDSLTKREKPEPRQGQGMRWVVSLWQQTTKLASPDHSVEGPCLIHSLLVQATDVGFGRTCSLPESMQPATAEGFPLLAAQDGLLNNQKGTIQDRPSWSGRLALYSVNLEPLDSRLHCRNPALVV